MENASKALLIAASILVAIVLVAIGMSVLGAAEGTADDAGTSMITAEVTSFNNKFLGYVGSNKSKSQVASLINLVISNNATNDNHKVKINGEDTTAGLAPKLQNLIEGNNYLINVNVTGVTHFDTNGFLVEIYVYNGTNLI